MSTYLVFGATGNVGRRVAERLAWSGAAVRATSRDPEAAKLPQGVEVITPDLETPGALDDIEGAFLMWPFHSAEPARPIVDALKRRVRHVVFMTGGGALPGVAPEEQPNPVARWQELTLEQERARLPTDPDFPGGFIDELLDGYTKMAAAPRPEVTSAVPNITGAPATTLSAWAAEHAAEFGGDR
ncbi:SDR family oxidoreductase [Streptosporangium pseudovulgare]|uniref:NAD(P)-binding domain-containing protein n=1 Tax=Streptosporangium pseudovulgare TaxID=35765 RepID=A0ABQ2RAR6_9ACTN|nr:NAD(P)H-binding protein [Streptosporangium pseudovulgare]GGQ22496.1 hypothetical protein GCM10010140_61020 [Streptosporangium pseudovulgare]